MDSEFVAIPIFGIHQPVSALLHVGGSAVLGLLTVRWTGRGRSRVDRVIDRVRATLVFALSCVAVLGISGVYHWTDAASPWREILRRLDHAAIFVLIAGTLTLFNVIALRGARRRFMIGGSWAIALIAIALKLLFFHELTGGLGLALYVGVGFLGVASLLVMPAPRPRLPFGLLVLGASAYVTGALVDVHEAFVVVEGFVGSHEIFHAAVLVGIGCHWRGMVETCRSTPG